MNSFDLLIERTGKPVFLMKRGIDTQLFAPAKPTVRDGILRLDTWAEPRLKKMSAFFAASR